MTQNIHRVVVIGAGTMGAAIAAHLANAGLPVTLLDIVPKELTAEEIEKKLRLTDKIVRNRIVQKGLGAAINSRPASFVTRDHAALVDIGNLEDDFTVVGEADWIIEAIIENLEIKRDLMARIDEIRADHAIVSTNTSGIPVASIAKGMSDSFRTHFLGTHFFNPPRYLKLLEIIPTPDTLPEVVDLISKFCEIRLGKGVVYCKDTPNFIANRFFSVDNSFTLDYALKNDYTVKEVDVITGPPIGRPKTGTFRLLDLVGLDVGKYVTQNLVNAISHDEYALRSLTSEGVAALFQEMIDRGQLGNKTKKGFYKTERVNGKREFWELNLKTLDYEGPTKPRFDSIGKVKDTESVFDRLQIFMGADDRAARLVQAVIYHGMAYASQVIPEISDTPKSIDEAIRWGFVHEAGPFELWDQLGVAETLEKMTRAGYAPAPWVTEMLSKGKETFYLYQDDRQVGVYNPAKRDYDRITPPAGVIFLKDCKTKGNLVKKNPSASLVDLGDGVACLEFHTKMNTIDDDILRLMNEALDLVEVGDFDGLVIGNEGEHFSAGANLLGVVMGAQSGMWDQLEAVVKGLQDVNMRMRYSPKPVVLAPAGMVLGGGAEITMHASRVVSHIELYIGQVEIGPGVIPAGGGTKELLRRILNPAMRTEHADHLPYMQRIAELIAQAKVATSAEEARRFGFLTETDRVVMNRDRLLAEAKREVLHMVGAGYHPPVPEKIYAAGRDALAALRLSIFMYKDGKYISDHDALILEKLAYVMTGGELSAPTWVDEQYILDLEREAFLALCGEKKTQERMWHILQTGRPLRN
jgi:3-hydroxyacyl-CoA dehydrogenase